MIASLPVASEQVAADGTIKWLFDVGAGDAIETVFIPEADSRHALHLVAGRLRCQLPLLRHRPLRACSRNSAATAEIARPALACRSFELRRAPRARAGERAITNVVMMGNGEPLQNYARPCCRRSRIMLDDHGYGLSRRRGDGLDLGRGADDRPAARRLPGGAALSRCTRRLTTPCATSWCR